MDVQIVAIKDTLVKDVVDFYHSCLEDIFALTFPKEAIEKYHNDITLKILSSQVQSNDRVLLAAKINNNVVGIIFGTPVNGGIGTIAWVVVSQKHRGKRIGEQLMKRAFQKYLEHGAHKVVLYTETESGRRFYERVGMKLESKHPRHWWGIDHYCLTKLL